MVVSADVYDPVIEASQRPEESPAACDSALTRYHSRSDLAMGTELRCVRD